MKKSLLLAGVAVSLLPINANAIELKPYVGLDYVYSNASTNDLVIQDVFVGKDLYKNKFNSLNINVGTSVNNYLDIEAFYQNSAKAKGEMLVLVDSSNEYTDKIETSFYAYGVDAIGHLPLKEKFSAIASFGLGQYEFEMNGFGVNVKEDGIGVRVAAGLQYDINENFSIRGIARQILFNMDSVDNMTEFSVGFKYKF